MMATLSVVFFSAVCSAENYKFIVSRGNERLFVFEVARGVLEPTQTAPNAPAKPKLVMYTKPSCTPCKVGKAALQAAQDLPFDWYELNLLEESDVSVPKFEWNSPNGKMSLTGWYGLDRLVSEFKRTQTKIKSVQKVEKNLYNPSWTWPGNLNQHLQSAHRINTSGMSQDQMERVHDAAHEQMGKRGRR